MGIKVRLTKARIGFANGLAEAKALAPGAKAKYSGDFIIQDDTLVEEILPDGTKVKTTIEKVQLKLADEATKGKGKKFVELLEGKQKAYRDGNKHVSKGGEVYQGYEDLFYISAKSEKAANLRKADGSLVGGSFLCLDRDKSEIDPQSGKIYSGSHVNGVLEFYINTDPNKKGIFSAMKIVQFHSDGDAFGGTSAPADADDVEDLSVGEEETEEPMY